MSSDPKSHDDAALMRRIVADLTAETPTTPSWTEIERRSHAGAPAPATHGDGTGGRERRTRLLAVAAALVAVIGGGVAFVATRGSDGDDLLAPAETPPSSLVDEPDRVSATSVPAAGTTLPDPTNPDTIADTTIVPPSSGVPSTTATPTTTASPTTLPQLDERPLSEVSNLPDNAWVVATSLPDGFAPVYSLSDIERVEAYAHPDGRLIEVQTSVLQFPAGDPVSIAGNEWLRSEFDDRTAFVAEFGRSMVTVLGLGVDEGTLIETIGSLLAGSDTLVSAPRLITFDAGPTDLVAQDGGVTFEVDGNAGWYCATLTTPLTTGGGCRYGRAGQLASEVETGGSEDPETGAISTFAVGIVAPEVATVEVALSDGSTAQRSTTDLSGLYDDRFYVVTVPPSDDPFIGRLDVDEVRLLDVDGQLLGTAPLPEF